MRAKIIRNLLLGTLFVSSVLWFSGQRSVEAVTRPFETDSGSTAEKGAAAFMGAGFGGISMASLSSNAVPWRLAATALVMEERRLDPYAPINQATLKKVLSRFGFLSPKEIVNQPQQVSGTNKDLPLGITHGTIHPIGGTRIKVANLGCASCHSGVTYAANGNPSPDRVMLGMPNTSLNLEEYTQTIFVAMRRHANGPDLLETANTLFPEMSLTERLSLRWIVLPLAKKRLGELAGLDRPLPFPNGSPGSTNGVAALKFALGTPLLGGGSADAGVVSIPSLEDRVLKTGFLADGAYGIKDKPAASVMTPDRLDANHLASLGAITTFFTIPSMGVHPDRAREGLEDGTKILWFLKDFRGQQYPAPIDAARATRGAIVYQSNCSSCHGSYDQAAPKPQLVRYPNWTGDVGTDKLRASSFDPALVEGVRQTNYADTFSVNVGRGYVAPPLSGIWATAPYLHNGSIANLADLLEPSKRYPRFKVGGHALDFDTVGIKLEANGDYPEAYKPFSTPKWVETNQPGRSNAGHTHGSTLTQPDKAALIEYLKSL
jgi:mono/diheme cytochrome c family protein